MGLVVVCSQRKPLFFPLRIQGKGVPCAGRFRREDSLIQDKIVPLFDRKRGEREFLGLI
jgi:hypothetical protein